MKILSLYFIKILAFSCCLLSSCDPSKSDIIQDTHIDLEEVNATLPVMDNSLRRDWSLIVGDKEYAYNNITNGITGYPKTESYLMDKANNEIQINFYRKYFTPEDKNDYSDQSTKQKIVRAGWLRGVYKGAAAKKINVDFKYALMLVDIEVRGTDKELNMSLFSELQCKPYKIAANRFQLVAMTDEVGMQLFIGQECYDLLLSLKPFTPDRRKKFVIQYNAASDEISVLSENVSVWSSEEWPQ